MFAPQAAQVVGHLPGGVAGDQPGDQLAQGAVRQAREQVLKTAQAGEERHRARLAEALGRGRVGHLRSMAAPRAGASWRLARIGTPGVDGRGSAG